jgi:5-methylphenazine-1-carboxylate 1-monooxygenase
MDIAVVGAGVGGLTAALSLHAAGFRRITVLEAVDVLRPLGVGLNVLPNAVRELDGLGLLEPLVANAVATDELVFYNRHGDLIWAEPRGLAAGCRWPQLSICRSRLLDTLLATARRRLGPRSLRTGARVTGFGSRPDGRLRLDLVGPDGTPGTADADLVIGADGIRSAIRTTMYPNEGAPVPSGMIMYRGMTWCRAFRTGRTMMVVGDDQRRFVCYPVEHSRANRDWVLVNWVAGVPGTDPRILDPDRRCPPRDVLAHFGGWRLAGVDLAGIVAATDQILVYPMVDRPPLPRWTFGRATLLGDAAHPMYPMGSNGATQAIIDARAVAHSLASQRDPGQALERFERIRRPAVTAVQAAGRTHGPEAAIALAHDRAPNGFATVGQVIAEHELREISERYATIAGFDVPTVNAGSPWGTGR